MDTLKLLGKYVLLLVGFIMLSEILINVGLNSTYEQIERKDNIEQVNIYQAEATSVNGRIRGIITNSKPEELNGKYVRIDFYSKRDAYLGKKYIEINNLEQNETMGFEALFELQEVGSYEVVITDTKDSEEEIEMVINGLTKTEIWVA